MMVNMLVTVTGNLNEIIIKKTPANNVESFRQVSPFYSCV